MIEYLIKNSDRDKVAFKKSMHQWSIFASESTDLNLQNFMIEYLKSIKDDDKNYYAVVILDSFIRSFNITL